jgi:hypothetical protein
MQSRRHFGTSTHFYGPVRHSHGPDIDSISSVLIGGLPAVLGCDLENEEEHVLDRGNPRPCLDLSSLAFCLL